MRKLRTITWDANPPDLLEKFISRTEHRMNLPAAMVVGDSLGLLWACGPHFFTLLAILPNFMPTHTALGDQGLLHLVDDFTGRGRPSKAVKVDNLPKYEAVGFFPHEIVRMQIINPTPSL